MPSALIHGRSSLGRLADYREQVALQFRSEEELDTLIDALWEDEDLYGIPRTYVATDTIIVPAQIVPQLKTKGFQFIENRVVSAGELPPAKIARIRRQQGPF